MAANPKDDELLGTAPINSLMVKLIFPAMLAQIINLLYNVVDRIFIAKIPVVGEIALTGVGVSYPVLMIISAFAAFAGMGGAPLASISLGSGDKQRAEKILGAAVQLVVAFAVVLTIFFSVFKEPILYAFGASDETIQYAVDYVSIYVLGTISVQIALGLNTFISAQGRSLIAMASVTIGAAINILLDYIFIMNLGLGVKGAALATILSQTCSALWVLRFLCSDKSSLRIRKEHLRPDPQIIKPILALGVAPFIMQSTEGLVSIVLNKNLQIFGGDLYVGVMTVVQSVAQMIFLPLSGISQGTQPIMGYNFGARKYARVRETFGKLIVVALTFATCTSAAAIFAPNLFTQVFTDKEDWLQTAQVVMPIYFAGTWALGIQMSCQATFMAMGQAKISLFLAMLRKIILLVPLVLILPRVTGNVVSIFVAAPVADILAAATTLILFLHHRKRLLPKE